MLVSSAGWLAYSGLSSVTFSSTWSARSGWVASQPESMTPTFTPLPVNPRERSDRAAAVEEETSSLEAVSL